MKKKEFRLVKSTYDLLFKEEPVMKKKEPKKVEMKNKSALGRLYEEAKIKNTIYRVKNRNPFLEIIDVSGIIK
ncbi:MAG: hypothetical protein ABJO28_08765 [Maribacter dokdonensis]|uniref:hypothetical protein n=1 Tax=Maribacter dokdonensis TaxID=320912 RepID=UPI003297ADCD